MQPSLPTDQSPQPDQLAPADMSLSRVPGRLRRARLRAGFSQRFAAAETFGWDYPDYVAHERGQASLSLQAAKRYAQAFGISVEWLLYGMGEMDRRGDARHDLTLQELRAEVERLTRENAALLVLVNGGARGVE